MNRNILRTASLLGAASVVLGAFGAHKLKELLPPDGLTVFETAVRYQFYHVLALFCTGIVSHQYARSGGGYFKWASRFFTGGILFFSGSLYLLTAMRIEGVQGFRFVGICTPVGGVFFIVGWVLLFWGLSGKGGTVDR